MPAPAGKFTDLPEIAAYVLAHAAGIACGFIVNPMILRGLIAQGHRDHLLLVGIGLGIVVSALVLLIFLLLRKAMAAPRERLTDLREIAAYVLAHAAGIAWSAAVNPMIFRSLIAQGLHNLMLPAIALSIAVSVVVLLIFLFLRKAMAQPSKPT
jgi:phosphotransferase system  glucose/maltose/N-acetylglucosamine-specific IIC component